MSEYDRQKDIAAEGQRAALYHGSKEHTAYVHDMITKSPEQKVIDTLVAALEASRTALDDWINLHAPEHCNEERVAEARRRVNEGGTLWYLAVTQERNRAALALARGDPK